MILVDATFICVGGGAVLLAQLVDSFGAGDITFLLDHRLTLERWPRQFHLINHGELGRLHWYSKHHHEISRLLCFGNIPPPFRLDCPVGTYVHNVLLLRAEPSGLPFLRDLVYVLKHWYLRYRASNTDFFAVQTPETARLLSSSLDLPLESVLLWPFWNEGAYAHLAGRIRPSDTFCYVSLPSPHKRHAELLQAWEQLFDEGMTPELHLTIPFEHPLARIVATLVSRGLRIINHGHCDPAQVYEAARYHIYPSRFESFGLGLIEGIEAGCDVLVPDHPYARNIVEASFVWEGGVVSGVKHAVNTVLNHPPHQSSLRVINHLKEIGRFLNVPRAVAE